jgi:transcription elongation factor Elf1
MFLLSFLIYGFRMSAMNCEEARYSVLPDLKRFDMAKEPTRTRFYLKPIIWLLSKPAVVSHHVRITKTNMEDLEKDGVPYLLLCNHNAFMDFKVAAMALWPRIFSPIVAIDGFLGREWLLRSVYAICKRKFTNDSRLIKNIKTVLHNGDISVIYPEARYSLCGTTAILPDSLGKMARYLKVPVAVLICHGNHINSPFWALGDRKVHTEAEMKQILTVEDLKSLNLEEINKRIREAFVYDDFAWQRGNNISIDYPRRAEGLHKVLYQCPHCKAECLMESKGSRLICKNCSKEWEMDELGVLHGSDGVTEFSHIPDWYEWERKQVRKEVEEGSYFFEAEGHLMSLPNARKFLELGKAYVRHDTSGFLLVGNYKEKRLEVHIPVSAMYSCHIEYEYLGKWGDGIDLNTIDDTFFFFPNPEKRFSVTKIALATEELYMHNSAVLSDCLKGNTESMETNNII